MNNVKITLDNISKTIIKDKGGNVIYDGITNNINIFLEKNIYHFYFYTLNKTLFIPILVRNDLCFNFKLNDEIKKIILIDKNYHNLPIEKGEINLWQLIM